MAETIIVVLILLGLAIALLSVMSSKNRYSEMSEEEFEEDVKKGNPLGAAVLGMERVLRRRESDIVIEAKQRVEKDEAEVGGEPPEEYETNGPGADAPDPEKKK